MYSFLDALLQPHCLLTVVLLLISIQLLRTRGETRRWRIALVVSIGLLLVLSTPLVGWLSLLTLETRYSPLEQAPPRTATIVVLGGGTRLYEGPEEHFRLSPSTMSRCVHAFWLYRKAGGCKLLVSGGKVNPAWPGPSEARAMSDFLTGLGVAPTDLLLEEESRTTYENALLSCRILEERHTDEIVLVTDASHMTRGSRCFRAMGIEVTEAPCNFRARDYRWSPSAFLPQARGADMTQTAFHEWMGLAWYWMHGRL